MDIVGIGIVATFFSMLAVSVFGVQSQKPPTTQPAPIVRIRERPRN